MTRLWLRAAACLAVALIGLLGCSGADQGRDSLAPTSEAERIPTASATEAAEAAEARFRLRADSTPRLELLERLSQSEGFRIAGPTDGLGVTTASIEAQSVEAVLAALLHDVPFSLHYRVEGAGPLVGLAEVELWPYEAPSRGEVASSEDASDSAPSAAGRARRTDVELAKKVSRGVPLTTHETRERFEVRRAYQESARAIALRDFESEDGDVRHAALPFLDAERPVDAQRLSHLALDDPDPRVRLEAVEQLSFGDPRVAIPILREAMLDSDEPVATTAKNELEHALGQVSQD
ncbi:MAG: HEAT repeat domain-containing protein [Myxococcota bacterium]|nr:HEAT repeat domain-containing protein [Myxococcota bacterium]